MDSRFRGSDRLFGLGALLELSFFSKHEVVGQPLYPLLSKGENHPAPYAQGILVQMLSKQKSILDKGDTQSRLMTHLKKIKKKRKEMPCQ
jgi:hypothetical protein